MRDPSNKPIQLAPRHDLDIWPSSRLNLLLRGRRKFSEFPCFILTVWPLTNSDFPTDQTFHQCHDLYTELGLHRIVSGFHGAFATGVASQQGTLTLPGTWFRPTFWDLLMLQLLRPNSSNLPCLYSTFHLEYPLVLSRFCFIKILADYTPKEYSSSRGIADTCTFA